MRKKIGFKHTEKEDEERTVAIDYGPPHLGTVSLDTDPDSQKDLEIQAVVRNLYITLKDRMFNRYGPRCIGKGVAMMKTLFPDGIPVEKYLDAFVLVRMLDKIVRVADGKPDHDDDDGWGDIAGYAVRRLAEDEDDE